MSFNPQRLVGAAATWMGPSPGRWALVGFQSSAARRSRCNAPVPTTTPSPEEFQSSAARRSRCNLDTPSPISVLNEFQSSAARRSRCNRTIDDRGTDPSCVSILSGSSEPLQLALATAAEARETLFQSSAARRSRCNARRPPGTASLGWFQSSAARRSRCNGALLALPQLRRLVSILSGSSEPLQPAVERPHRSDGAVSILSGSSEPLQPRRLACSSTPPPSFNPQRLVGAAATRKAGCGPP